MSKLVRMDISGIRSFGCEREDEQHIHFQSPITLFLGQNGCGKTTIIEALKFACTDDLPDGCMNGQGFVNDPKINSKASSKGLIKVKIEDAQGNSAVFVKVVTVQMKGAANKLTFKRLDNAVIYQKLNQPEKTVNGRAEEIAQIACGMLGVSKAIINNVIFCHQEDSLWPLGDSSKVKETFDKIFDATKYNQYSDALRKLTKANAITVKDLEKEVVYTREKKESVERERTKMHDQEKKSANLKALLADCEEAQKPIIKRLTEVGDLEKVLGELQMECSAKMSEIKGLQEQQKTIRKNFDRDYPGTVEQLKEEIRSFDDVQKNWNNEIQTAKRNKLMVQMGQEKIEKEGIKVQARIAEIKADLDQNSKDILDRNQQVKRCEEIFKLDHVSIISNTGVERALEKLGLELSKLEKTFEKTSEENDSEENKLQTLVEHAMKNHSNTEQQITIKRQQLQEIKREYIELQNQMQDLKVSDEKLRGFAMDIERINKDVDNLNKSFDADKIEHSIKEKKLEVKQLDMEVESLENDYKVMQKNYTAEKQLQTLKCDVIKKESDIAKIKNKHHEYFESFFQNTSSGYSDKVVKVEQEVSRKIQDATTKKNQAECKTSELKVMRENQKSKIKEYSRELDECERKVRSVCKGKDYLTVRKECDERVESLQRDKGQYSSAKIMYKKFINEFESSKPCCPVCSSDFKDNRGKVEDIITTLKQKIVMIPEKLKLTTDDLKTAQTQYNEVVKLESTNSKIVTLKEQISNANDAIVDLDKKLVIQKEIISSLVKDLVDPEEKKDVCKKLQTDAALLDQYKKDINSAENSRLQLESQLTEINSSKSMEETESTISDLKAQLNRLRDDVDFDQKKLMQNKTKLQNLKDRRTEINEKKLQIEKNMQGKPQLIDQSIKLKSSQETIASEIKDLEGKLIQYQDELNDARDNLNMVKQTNKAVKEEHREDLNNRKSQVDRIVQIQNKIEEFEAKKLDITYDKEKSTFEELQTRKQHLTADIETITKEILDISNKLASQENELRKLNDYLLLHDKHVEEENVAKEVSKLREKIGSNNLKALDEEKRRLNKDWLAINNDLSKYKGQREELTISIQDLRVSLEKPLNRDAHKTYESTKRKHIVMRQVGEDLKQFTLSVDMAIIKFHREKMTQINKTIRDLWRQIYRGNDIDSIEIKTEQTTTTGTRRTYNYCVTQLKNNVELDMRGRCSAGQKVLACLIIRIALAETFSCECSVFALDEPTTNLDRENIISLSEALVRLIERQGNKNFQLLIITHDEEFLNTLRNVAKQGSYYEVTRNDNGNSRVTRRDY